MQGKSHASATLFAGLVAMASSVFGSDALAQDIKLRVADSFPSGHFIAVQGAKVWMDRVSELTNSKVAFDYFTSGQLGNLADMLDVAQNRVADISYVPMSSFAERLPLSGVVELPGLFVKAEKGSNAFMNLLKDDIIAGEFAQYDVVPLWGAVLPQYQVAVNGDPIDQLGDFDNVRLRTPGGILEIAADELGALAVPMGGPDMYTAFQRGTVDATLNAFASMRSYRLNEVLKSVSTNGSFGSFAVTYVMNRDAYDALPEDVRAAMQQAGQDASTHLANWMDANETSIAAKFAEGGVKIYEIQPDALSEWNKRLGLVSDRWASRLDERGMKGSAVLARWKAAIAATGK